jgi:hypothetical protein
LAFIVTRQLVLFPLQAPLHPPKDAFAPGTSFSVTCVPGGKLALQVGGQLIPPELLVTVPVPVPASVTLNTGSPCITLKVAVTCWLALRVKAHWELVLPLQGPPDQPAKDEFVAAAAVSVT